MTYSRTMGRANHNGSSDQLAEMMIIIINKTKMNEKKEERRGAGQTQEMKRNK